MSLTEANLRAHDTVAAWGKPQLTPTSQSAQGTTRSTAKSRPSDSIGSIVGFGGAAAPGGSVRGCSSTAASSRCVAVGHGSVRPPPSRCSSTTDRGALESMAIESLEVQLEEERHIRIAMERKLETLSSMVERLSSAAPTPEPRELTKGPRRVPSGQPRTRTVSFKK